MKIPKTLKVGAHSYKIQIKKVRDNAKGANNWGKTSFATGELFLDSELIPSMLEETFLHEICHIACYQTGLTQKLEEKEEEDIVNRISLGLYAILKENKLI